MAHYDLYWVERQKEQRTPEVLRFEAFGVLKAGIHYAAQKILTCFVVTAIPYNEWHNDRRLIDRLVASSQNPQAIFAKDTIIANANFRTTRDLIPKELNTLDKLMEGIDFVPISAQADIQ